MSAGKQQKSPLAIEPRKRPRQERSSDMVDRILAATLQLARAGPRGLTTNAIAQHAGLSVGSLYQYYPNREAIILDLARRWLSLFPEAMALLDHGDIPGGWTEFQQQFRLYGRSIAQFYLDYADLLPMLAAMHLDPDLSRIMADFDNAAIESYAAWLQRINPALASGTARRLGLGILELGHTGLSVAVRQQPEIREAMTEDLLRALLAMMQPYMALS